MTKHQPNVFWRYKQIHENVMNQFRRDGFIRADDLKFELSSPIHITLKGRIECAGWIYITVGKTLRILRGAGETAAVQTESYSYSVVLEGEGNIIRHDSPHAHRPDHHIHRFDTLRGDAIGTLQVIRDGQHPTLGQVIGAAREWFYENIDEMNRRRLKDLESGELQAQSDPAAPRVPST